jgi:hypothetical protein
MSKMYERPVQLDIFYTYFNDYASVIVWSKIEKKIEDWDIPNFNIVGFIRASERMVCKNN